MQLSLNDIKIFSRCPASFLFSRKNPIIEVPTLKNKIITNAIKECYMNHAETGFTTNWKKILKYVDEKVFKNIDISNPTEFEKGKKQSEHLLNSIHTWYKRYYLQEDCSAFSNVEVSSTICGCEIKDTIPLVKLTEPLTILYIDDILVTKVQMYNDLLIRGLAWLLSNQFDGEAIKVEHLLIGKSGSLEVTDILCNKKANDRIENILYNIVKSITYKNFYPSITSACNSCPFLKKCEV